MAEKNIALTSSSTLLNESGNMIDGVENFRKIIKDIYDTFDALKESWTGEKADQYKATLEEVREPLTKMCDVSATSSEKLNKVGQIVSDYLGK